MKRVIVLRPEPGASETVRRARELGLDAAAIPLFEIEPIAWSPPDPAQFDALLLTSANAIRHGGAGLAVLRGLAVHAVGEATAEAAREAGFKIAAVGDSGVDALLSSIDPGQWLLHPCGEDRTAPTANRHRITALRIYRSPPIASPGALTELSGAVVLVHSPRAGRRLAELILDRSAIAVAAISPAAAAAVGEGWSSVEAAERPSDDALLEIAIRLCNKPERR
jgi:uroporphyrinogen-III synthase